MDKALAMQMQIRQNAEELSSTLSDMSSWEKKMREKDTRLRHGKPVVTPRERKVTREGGTVQLKTSITTKSASSAPPSIPLTPASIVDNVVNNIPSSSSVKGVTVPSARGRYEQRDLEEVEREAGNAEFKAGNFAAAVKCYTKCLGLKSNNYVAFSNRAMAYLKLKDYLRAAIDCDCALKIEPTHVKSLLRRATAFNALGKHRAALLDLMAAQELEPSNKQVRSDMAQTKELLRASVNRAPHSTLRSYDELLALHEEHRQGNEKDKAMVEGKQQDVLASEVSVEEAEEDGVVQGPDPLPASFLLPTPAPAPSVTDNNTRSSSNSKIQDTLQEAKTSEDTPSSSSASSSSTKDNETSVRIPISLASDDEDSDTETPQQDNPPKPATVNDQQHEDTISPGMHRIAIIDDSDEDERDHRHASLQSTTKLPISETAAATPKPETKKKKTTVASSSANSKATKTSPKKSPMKATTVSALKGAYELEKALIQVQGDLPAMQQLLRTLHPTKDASRIFQTVVEPDAMVLLLDSLWQVLHATKDNDKAAEDGQVSSDLFWQWCYALQALSSFSLFYSLVARDAKEALQMRLRQLQTDAPWQGHSKKMATVIQKFG